MRRPSQFLFFEHIIKRMTTLSITLDKFATLLSHYDVKQEHYKLVELDGVDKVKTEMHKTPELLYASIKKYARKYLNKEKIIKYEIYTKKGPWKKYSFKINNNEELKRHTLFMIGLISSQVTVPQTYNVLPAYHISRFAEKTSSSAKHRVLSKMENITPTVQITHRKKKPSVSPQMIYVFEKEPQDWDKYFKRKVKRLYGREFIQSLPSDIALNDAYRHVQALIRKVEETDDLTPSYAYARRGHIHGFIALEKAGYDPTEEIALIAVQFAHMPLLEWLKEREVYPPNNAYSFAREKTIKKWLRKEGYR